MIYFHGGFLGLKFEEHFSDMFKPCASAGCFPLFKKMLHLVVSIANRVIANRVGKNISPMNT
jgi:hypothetical protein